MWSRASAGLLPGFLLAAAATGWIAWMLPGPWRHALIPATLAFIPLWTAAFCACFAFRSGRRAWLWMLPLAVVGLGLLRALQDTGWVQ